MLIINKLEEIIEQFEEVEEEDLSIIREVIYKSSEYEKSWSGSILGYHSNVYYRDFKAPPENTYFSQEWGINHISYLSSIGLNSQGDWVEYNREYIRGNILSSIDENDISIIIDLSEKTRALLEESRDKVLSIIYSQNIISQDEYLIKLVDFFKQFLVFKQKNFESYFLKKFAGKFYTRDIRLQSGNISVRLPEHQIIICQMEEILSPFEQSKNFIKHIKKIQEHIRNIQTVMVNKEMINDFNALDEKGRTVYNIGSVQNMANHNSGDYLQQSVNNNYLSIFDEIKNKIQNSNEDSEIIKDLIELIEEMDKNKNTNEYKISYSKFIENAAKSVGVLNSIVDFIPKLVNYLP